VRPHVTKALQALPQLLGQFGKEVLMANIQLAPNEKAGTLLESSLGTDSSNNNDMSHSGQFEVKVK